MMIEHVYADVERHGIRTQHTYVMSYALMTSLLMPVLRLPVEIVYLLASSLCVPPSNLLPFLPHPPPRDSEFLSFSCIFTPIVTNNHSHHTPTKLCKSPVLKLRKHTNSKFLQIYRLYTCCLCAYGTHVYACANAYLLFYFCVSWPAQKHAVIGLPNERAPPASSLLRHLVLHHTCQKPHHPLQLPHPTLRP